MLNIAVLVSGGGTNLQAIIDSIESGYISNGRICVVISNNRGVRALERADDHDIPNAVISPKDYEDNDAFADAMASKLAEYGTELIVLAGYLVKVPEKLIDLYPNKIMNIHPALIPSFCGKGFYGLKVHEAVIDRGVKVTGATVHFVNRDLDEGPIILQKTSKVRKDDTPEVLQRRVMEECEWKILPEAIKLYSEGKIVMEGGRAYVISEE